MTKKHPVEDHSDQEEQQVQEAEKAPEVVEHVSETSHRHGRHAGLWLFSFLSFVVAIVAIVFVILMWTKDTSQQGSLQALKQSIQANANQLGGLASQLSSHEQTLNEQKKAIDSAQNALADLAKEIDQNQDMWQLSDAAHLLQLANYTLSFDHDIPTTIKILKTADSRLASLTDPDVFPLRQLIAKEIVALASVKQVDISGIYSQLNALREKVASLPTYSDRFASDDDNNLIKQNSPTKEGTFTHGVWHALSQIVVIRHHQKRVEPILTVAQHRLLLENFDYLFSQAQWALLHRQQTVYQQSIGEIIKLLDVYYQPDDVAVVSVVDMLQKLEKVTVNPKLPNIDSALKATQALLKKRDQDLLTHLSSENKQQQKANKQ